VAQPIRRRLFLSYLAILLTGMGLAGLLTWRAVESLYLATQRENLLAQANLTAAALQGQVLPLDPSQPYQQTSNALPGIHTRLLNEQGAVVVGLPVSSGDITVPPAENSVVISPEELKQRPEIQQAMLGQSATAIRRVTSRKILYAAAPIFGGDGSVAGLVYLATPLPGAGLPTLWIFELLGAALAAILLASLAGTWIARRISRPVETMAQAAAAIGEGHLDQHVAVENDIRELNGLAQAFNSMTESLRRSNEVKNAFVADVTHELRTPLTVIKGTIETLEDGAINDIEGRAPLLTSMQHESDRLIRLVNDLLVLTRADAGTLRLSLHPLDLVKLAKTRCEQFSTLPIQSQVQLEVIGAESAWVLADADRVSQVIDNLLDNALRYSREGSTVRVEISTGPDTCECAVSDSGPGIPQQHLSLIFERFYRVDTSRNRQTGGAGLGLAIAQSLITAQGGSIRASSVEGQGATIHFSLPTASQLP
jgi:signal transduction histidine kinase